MMTAHILATLLFSGPDSISVHFAGTTAAPKPFELSQSSKFKVSMYNKQLETIVLPGENCSWGYEMISFEVKSPAGKLFTIIRKPKPWDKNFPVAVEVPKNDLLLRQIDFNDKTWTGFPAGIAGSPDGWIIRVTLSVDMINGSTGGKHFWSGKVSSRWKPVTF